MYKQQCPRCLLIKKVEEIIPGEPVCVKCQEQGWWKTSDDSILHVNAMSNSHIVNLVKFLIKSAKKSVAHSVSNAYTLAGFVNGEMAQVSAWDEVHYFENEVTWEDYFYSKPITKSLLDEVKRRKLTLDI